MSVHSKFLSQVFDQVYGPKPKIEGVEIISLTLHTDDGGNFLEIARIAEGKVEGLQAPFEVRQFSMSVLTPGAIKAFHLHSHQDDLWYTAPTERLLVNLHDVRQESPTFDQHMRLILGGGQSFLLRIPHEVAHGIANLYDRNMFMFYLTNQQFDAQNPDEHRLPWDAFGSEIWEVTKG